ncbi:hypothetical protein PGPR2_01860 [Pseudomonas aeruginosa PGPR2]|nr:hypothetical protein PGPR2_01860 [Pseudomonas aeruginosa PGPR2]
MLVAVTLGLSSFGAALLSFAILCQVIHTPEHKRGYQSDHQP